MLYHDSVSRRQQAQVQLLIIMTKIDDLFDILNAEGIHADSLFQRAGLRCRRQVTAETAALQEEGEAIGMQHVPSLEELGETQLNHFPADLVRDIKDDATDENGCPLVVNVLASNWVSEVK